MAADKVTLWTSSYFLDSSKASEEKGLGCYFESQIYWGDKESEWLAEPSSSHPPNAIIPHLEDSLLSVQSHNAALIIIAQVEGDSIWLGTAFSRVFPGLPSSFCPNLMETCKRGPGSVTLPSTKMDTRSMNFLLHYPMARTDAKSEGSSKSFDDKVSFHPVATWLTSRSDPQSSRNGATPVILIVCTDDGIPKKLQEHCVSGNWNVKPLRKCPARIFIDLEMIFAEWSLVWNIARQDLAERSAQVYGETKKVSVLDLTRDLHRDASRVISLQEDLRLHLSALQKYQNIIWQPTSLMSELVGKEERNSLEDSIEECSQNLQHQQESSVVIYKQLENLLSLAFNTEMVAQGHAVGRLNFLALAFLPLSFVAALFGMTNFDIPSRWYPVWAIVVLCIVLGGFLLVDRFPIQKSKLAMNSSSAPKSGSKTRPSKVLAQNLSRKGKEKCVDPEQALETMQPLESWERRLELQRQDYISAAFPMPLTGPPTNIRVPEKIDGINMLNLSGAGIHRWHEIDVLPVPSPSGPSSTARRLNIPGSESQASNPSPRSNSPLLNNQSQAGSFVGESGPSIPRAVV